VAHAAAQEQRGEREGREEEEEERGLGRDGAEPVVGPAEQRPRLAGERRRLRLLVVGLRVVERRVEVERRGAGAGADGRRAEQRRRGPRQLSARPGPAAAVPVHPSPPSRRRVSCAPAPGNPAALASLFSRVERSSCFGFVPPRTRWIDAEGGVVGNWRGRKKRGSGAGEAPPITTGGGGGQLPCGLAQVVWFQRFLEFFSI